jgi:hypothetical protein
MDHKGECLMAMVYQKGSVYAKGKRIKKWYGQFRLYMRDREGKEVERTRKVVLGLKSELRKYEAEEKLQAIIREVNGKIGSVAPILQADNSVTFNWFVKEKYLPIRRGRWRPATREKTEHEISKYLVEKFRNVPLRDIGLFELQTQLNGLASKYSESVVKHAFVNLRSIMRMAQKLKFITENLGDETRMPVTRPVERPTITPEQINRLIQGIEEPHDLCLMCIGLFCATRTSETFGLQWKSYLGDSLMIHSTAYEGKLYEAKSKREQAGMRSQFRMTLFLSLRLGDRYARTSRPMDLCSQHTAPASARGSKSRDEQKTSSSGGLIRSPTN